MEIGCAAAGRNLFAQWSFCAWANAAIIGYMEYCSSALDFLPRQHGRTVPLCCPLVLDGYANDFFLYVYFGIVTNKLKTRDQTIEADTRESAAIKCAYRAYLDLCRTLTYNEKICEKEKNDFLRNVCTELVEELLKRFFLIRKYRYERSEPRGSARFPSGGGSGFEPKAKNQEGGHPRSGS